MLFQGVIQLIFDSCIAISGLGSHAFGSWKDRQSHFMWLRDALPYEVPGARIFTYGYDTRLAQSNSFQNLEDVALTFCASLKIALGSRPPDRPLIFIAHSLGGLVLKQALIQLASRDNFDRQIVQSTYGILFFGVPNQGMNIGSLLPMVGSQPNVPFLTLLSKDSGNLQGLIDRFRTTFDFKDSEIISFYETDASRTAREDGDGKWSMSGDYAVLVDRFSAKSGRSWEETQSFLHPIGRNHSDMVKFSEYDDCGDIVCQFLVRFAKAAPAVIENRTRSLGSSTMSFTSAAKPLPFGSPSKGEQAQIEQPKNPAFSRRATHENENDLEILANAGFYVKLKSSRKLGLVWAARQGHVALIESLLNRHVPIDTTDERGRTSLHWAVITGNLELFRMLLFRGANYCAITLDGDSALHLQCEISQDDYSEKASDREAMCLELLDRGLPIDLVNKKRMTALSCAAGGGLLKMVTLLISRGADITACDEDLCTPIIHAAKSGHTRVVEILKVKYAETHRSPDWNLVHAAFLGLTSAVRVLLDAEATIDAVDEDGDTALIKAAAQGHVDIVRLLLDIGADIEARHYNRGTALVWAAFNGHSNVVRLLLQKGANIEAVTESGNSALHGAARNYHLEVVEILLERGADPFALSKRKKSPLNYARERGHVEAVEILRKRMSQMKRS